MATWYERMRSAREKLNLTKTAFGKLVGVSQPTVTDWESGVMRPNGKNLLKASRVLGMTPEELMDGTAWKGPKKQPQENTALGPDIRHPEDSEGAWKSLTPKTRALIEELAQGALSDDDIKVLQGLASRMKKS